MSNSALNTYNKVRSLVGAEKPSKVTVHKNNKYRESEYLRYRSLSYRKVLLHIPCTWKKPIYEIQAKATFSAFQALQVLSYFKCNAHLFDVNLTYVINMLLNKFCIK